MKPMLAVEADIDTIRFPCYAQVKADGVRVVIKDGVVLSRSLKPIRNKHVQSLFGHLHGLDGELIVGDPTAPDVFQKTTSGVMSADGEPDVKFYVFDYWNLPDDRYSVRMTAAGMKINKDDKVILVQYGLVHNKEELLQIHQELLNQGWEGTMIRNPYQGYKYGRSTKKSQHLLKLKEFHDSEFKVVGFKERMHNTNKAKRNALGNLERSSAKDGLVGMDTLGALVLEYGEDTFDCGTGFDDQQRKWIWEHREEFLGSLAKVKYQPSGAKDKPRFPVWIGWRDEEDM